MTIFEKIIAREISAKIIWEDEDAIAFHDVNPQAPTHVLVVPAAHLVNAAAADSDEGERVLGRTLRFAVQVAKQLGLAEGGYRLVLNNGSNGGQSVDHLHVHVLGGRRMAWPPG